MADDNGAQAKARAVLAGDVRVAARLMRDLDDAQPGAVEVMRLVYPHTGRAFVVGVTGSPGVGKSTLVDALIAHQRARGKRVGVVTIDPTSALTGGAILGDRIRMQRHATDEGVFIRSLATRGQLGGLSRSTSDVVLVLDAMGFDEVIVETVGVGQDEVDVVTQVDTTVLVTVPGLGDEVQTMKAGILEIADVLVVNKADRTERSRAPVSADAGHAARADPRSSARRCRRGAVRTRGPGREVHRTRDRSLHRGRGHRGSGVRVTEGEARRRSAPGAAPRASGGWTR